MEAESNQEGDELRLPKVESAPWLVFIPNHACNKKGTIPYSSQTFYSISEGKSYVKHIDAMRGYNCWPTPQGWIFMQEPKSRRCCLWNPTTSVNIIVSTCKWNFSSKSNCVISSSPLEPGSSCRLMCVENGRRTLFVYDLHTKEWLRLDVGRRLYHLMVLNGQFYCITVFSELAVIDLVPSIKVRVLDKKYLHHPKKPIGRAFSFSSFFVDSNGEVFCVHIFFRMRKYSSKVLHVAVLRKDCSNETWDEVDRIGDQVFFLGPGAFAASCSANIGLKVKGNCIYFLDECCMHVFDMEEGTIQVEAPCPQFLYSAGSTLPVWIMPSK